MISGEVTVQVQAFAAAVKWTAKFVAAKPANPIQGGLLLDVEDGRLSILGHNESLTARAAVDADGDGSGQVVVSARLLAALVATFPNKPVRITGHDSEPLVTLTVGSWRGTLPAMTVGDFSPPPPAPPVIGCVRGDDLVATIRAGAAARSDSEKQPIVYHCLHLAFGESEVTAVATNMARAARAVTGFERTDGDVGETALVSATAVLDVAESLAGPDEIWIGMSGESIGLASPNRAVIMRQVGEKAAFPITQLGGVFRTELPERARVRVPDLQSPLKRAVLMRGGDEPIRVRFATGRIVLAAAAEELHQDSDEEVPAEYDGPEFELKFNPRYFGEALASAPGEVVDIALTTEMVTGIKLTAPGDAGWIHMMMPIKR